MGESQISSDVINRNKKRKLHQKHHRCCSPLLCSSKKAKNVENDRDSHESDQSGLESAKDSNSIPVNDDSMVVTTNEYEETNTMDLEYPGIRAALAGSSASSVCWSGAASSSDDGLCSVEGTEFSSVNETPIDCSCLECENHGIEEFEDHGIEDSLYSNGPAPDGYVLASGRWTVDRGSHEEEGKKVTIDKEFELYFSMLVLE